MTQKQCVIEALAIISAVWLLSRNFILRLILANEELKPRLLV